MGASGLQVVTAAYNLSRPGWEIEIAYSKSSPDATVVVYLPRTQTNAEGVYTAEFNRSFFPSNFPCAPRWTPA